MNQLYGPSFRPIYFPYRTRTSSSLWRAFWPRRLVSSPRLHALPFARKRQWTPWWSSSSPPPIRVVVTNTTTTFQLQQFLPLLYFLTTTTACRHASASAVAATSLKAGTGGDIGITISPMIYSAIQLSLMTDWWFRVIVVVVFIVNITYFPWARTIKAVTTITTTIHSTTMNQLNHQAAKTIIPITTTIITWSSSTSSPGVSPNSVSRRPIPNNFSIANHSKCHICNHGNSYNGIGDPSAPKKNLRTWYPMGIYEHRTFRNDRKNIMVEEENGLVGSIICWVNVNAAMVVMVLEQIIVRILPVVVVGVRMWCWNGNDYTTIIKCVLIWLHDDKWGVDE